MRAVLPRHLLLVGLILASAQVLCAQQAPSNFHWVNFHSPKDQDTVVWVQNSLAAENWTAIREIGVEWDAALVVTTERATLQSSPMSDTFAIYSVSLTNHSVTALLKGSNLRLLDWMEFALGRPRELTALYSNCTNCDPSTFLTAFFYDLRQHGWAMRWMHGSEAIRIGAQKVADDVSISQVYAVLADSNGHEMIATWNHFDYGKQKPDEDYLYQYDVDPWNGLDRTLVISGKDAETLKRRLCQATDAVSGLEAGQDSELCAPYNTVRSRRPTTTPPPNARGRSVPPGSHPRK